ncbi:hypothetical protein N7539_004378 [Penicillium diatomitis]|uniref:Sister chromatid cohesion protein n=1 Tax=Penicillium diatomitis TaxID=2819901 RepID=A0A9W9XEN9_9EURO|nr:uncharacterized protein N7539_004378 [Penicillium diatomitis]KAJ5489488.1 hypothetical protein N7539_004378 [Penicillium diatomitis]
MDNHGRPAVQVVINGHPQLQQAPESGVGLQYASLLGYRPLSVDEALQYSSMSSAPIFGLDCVIRPDVGRPSNTTSIEHVLQAGRITLSELDAEIDNGLDESSQLETSREYLQQLLEGDRLTEFNFKVPLSHALSPKSHTTTSNGSASCRSHLGAFARMILESTDIPFRYPPTATLPNNQQNTRGFPNPAASWNKQAYLANSSSTAFYEKPHQPSSQVSVVIPMKPTPTKSSKSKTSHQDEVTARRLRDQKAEADDALLKLQDVLHEIFEAEDQIEPGQSLAPTADKPNPIFVNFRSLEVDGPVLSSETHNRLQKAIRKVSGFDRLQDIPSDYLKRIQKLCEKPISAAQSAQITLHDPSNEAEVQEWLGKVEEVINGLLAIATLLQTMSGRQTERDLCPEDLIEAIPPVVEQLFDYCIIPAVESRPGGKDAELFKFFSAQRRIIASLIHQSKKALTLFADFLSRVEVPESSINSALFFAAKLIFVENAHNEKDSAVGSSKFEPARRGAMDVLAKIFSRYPAQRSYILDQILGSLEKLPSTRQSARQFKIADGKNIQLLTALVLQLVQTTALETSSRSNSKRRLQASADDDEDEVMDEASNEHDWDQDDEDDIGVILDRLAVRVNRLYDNAIRSAQYIVGFIVQRAINATKSGDQPFRNILDLFTEDLINVLGSTDWPASELLLRIMASHMVGIADQDKSSAQAKSMALELLGWMGSAISDLISNAQHMLPALEDNDLNDSLKQLFDDFTSRALHPQDLVATDGPYRMVLEYLLQDKSSDNSQLTSTRGFFMAAWAKVVCNLSWNSEDKEDVPEDSATGELVVLLSRALSDSLYLESHRKFTSISSASGRFAYILTVLNSGFGKAFDTILKVLLNSIASDQAKVRSRSLKSVIEMLEKDPNLLDRDASVMRLILRCTTDASPMVRDSALSLIAKCIGLRPKLEEQGCRSILACAGDATAGVRKRCIGLLRELYQKTSRQELKLATLDSFLQRTGDLDESVATLARQTFEEIWLVPFHESIDSLSDGPKVRMALGEHVGLIISLVERSETALDSLGTCVSAVLSSKSKSAALNFKVCKSMVSTMFQRLVEDADASQEFKQALLQTITVFAKANAKLFSPDQLEALHPYIGNLASADDLFLFRSVVVIYRCVLPYLSSAHNRLLKDVQNDLFKSVAKLGRPELNEVMACLWTINGVLQNTDRLVKLTLSVLKPLQQYRTVDMSSSANAKVLARAKSYIRIAGCVGRHCDLEKYIAHFRNAFPTWSSGSGGSVASLMVDCILPFTESTQPTELRVTALESVGAICQSWPAQFGREPTRSTFSQVLSEGSPGLQHIVLRSFADFFFIHEGKSEKGVVPTAETVAQEESTRLGGSLKASDNDGAAALIAQHFLKDMLQVAQSRQDAYALTAIELIASINRQGLVHPKECAGVLVSLETSTDPKIAKVAFDTHKMIHQQFESMFEREYMRAVQEAFYYQREVVGDSNGATARPYVAKLAPLFEIVKISNSRYQKKFLANLCAKADFELKKLDASGDPPEHLLVARFIAQNLAYFDYAQLAELLPTIGCLERIVSSTGTVVAHAIETDLFPTPIGPPVLDTSTDTASVSLDVSAPAAAIAPDSVDPQTLRLLATAAASLSMLWEARTHLRRLYGLNSQQRDKDGKSKQSAKELNKTATKVNGVTGERFWEAIVRNVASLNSREAMLSKCREFSTLLAIDEEFKVDQENGGESDPYDGLGDPDDAPGVLGSRPMKRKSSMSSHGLNKRPKARNGSVGK